MQKVINNGCLLLNMILSPKSAYLIVNSDSADDFYSLTLDGLSLERVD